MAKLDILVRLEELATKRLEAEMNAESKRSEVELRKLEIEAQYAEHLAKGRIEELKAKEEMRRTRKEWGSKGQKAWREREAVKAATPACPVCANSQSAHLTAQDIAWHHAGHPDNFTMPMNWN